MASANEPSRTCALPTSRTPGSRADARGAHLRYVSDCFPGIRRTRSTDGFAYEREDGEPLTPADLDRVRRLAVPPAWTDVWICADSDGHLQATGRDKRGRKQYRYHPRWRDARDGTKYDRMVAFGEALPGVRRRVDADLRSPALGRAKVLALLVALLDRTLIRIGNREYERANDSLGLSTLRDGNVRIDGADVRLRFRGKAGKVHVACVEDRRLSRAVRRLRDLPGQDLFQYVDASGERRVVGSGDVNGYLREITGEDLTSKDFRTWGGTLVVAAALAPEERPVAKRAAEHAVVEAVAEAANVLGNTPAVCRRSYVHPGVVDLYLRGALTSAWLRAAVDEDSRLRGEEQRLLAVLRGLA